MFLTSPYFVTIAKDLTPFIAAALTAGIAAGANFVLKHTHNAILDAAIYDGQSLMDSLVQSLNQTTVNAEKAAGTWTQETGVLVKDKALASWHLQMASHVRSVLKKALPDLEGVLGTWLETAVARAPNKTSAPTKSGDPEKPRDPAKAA